MIDLRTEYAAKIALCDKVLEHLNSKAYEYRNIDFKKDIYKDVRVIEEVRRQSDMYKERIAIEEVRKLCFIGILEDLNRLETDRALKQLPK